MTTDNINTNFPCIRIKCSKSVAFVFQQAQKFCARFVDMVTRIHQWNKCIVYFQMSLDNVAQLSGTFRRNDRKMKKQRKLTKMLTRQHQPQDQTNCDVSKHCYQSRTLCRLIPLVDAKFAVKREGNNDDMSWKKGFTECTSRRELKTSYFGCAYLHN